VQITFFSFFMAVFWSSVIILLLYAFRKNIFIGQFGLLSLLCLYVFCVIRMVFPLEFPFTKVVPVEDIYNPIHMVLQAEIFRIGSFSIDFGGLLICLWLLVTAILLFRFAVHYRKHIKVFSHLSGCKEERTQKIFEKVRGESRRKLNMGVIYTDLVDYPTGIGIFRKRILLRDDVYTDEELYYIFRHEYMHFLNKDLIVKMLVQIFCYVFWWNPLVYLLRKDLDRVLEIKCDLKVTETMNNSERAEYLSTIVSVVKVNRKTKSPHVSVPLVALFNNRKKSNLEERFQYVSKGISKRKNAFLRCVAVLIFCLTVFLSYSFVFQSKFQAPMDGGIESYDTNELYITTDEKGDYHMVFPDGTRSPIENYEANKEMLESEGIKLIDEETEK
jgi:Antirepressor regulating drug resistance, predicted signal transduction N-terminal membrane component